MKKVSVPISYLVLTLISLSMLIFATACGSSGGGPFPAEETPPPNGTPTPANTPTPGSGNTPVPTSTPAGRATPAPGPSPDPFPAAQGPLAPTATDKQGTWISNVYWGYQGQRYMLVLTNIPSTNYTNLSWDQARQAAAEKILNGKSGHLVAITSLEEQRLLMSTFDHCYGKTASATETQSVSAAFASNSDNKNNPLVGMALGGYRENGVWKWVTDEPFVVSQGYWLAGYIPSKPGVDSSLENYLQIYTVNFPDSPTFSRYGWNNYIGNGPDGISQTFGYIVEFEP
jgi:hypothetical protein